VIDRASSADRARLVGVVASAAVLVTTVAVAGTVTPGYRPLADAVSRLGSHDEPHAWILRFGLTAYGILVLVGSGPLSAIVPTRARLVALLVAGYGLAAIVAGVAPKDPPRSPHTLTSQIHVAATLVGGAVLLTAMAIASCRAPVRSDRRLARIVGSLTTLGVIIFPFAWGSPVYGLLEMLLLGAATLWLVALALRSMSPTH
jgi:hypothetical membrane protein